ncbi:hypothetical protein OKW49_008416 [Paraburkholderia youngii]|uniref:hypothetical protein n=1 Tax=Paraburkholderia youngii TaxID=2782701 RepID=UPI003D219E43
MIVWIIIVVGLLWLVAQQQYVQKRLWALLRRLRLGELLHQRFPELVPVPAAAIGRGSPDLTPLGISLVVLAAALYVILFKHDADAESKNWAFGACGTILGFWLKAPERLSKPKEPKRTRRSRHKLKLPTRPRRR